MPKQNPYILPSERAGSRAVHSSATILLAFAWMLMSQLYAQHMSSSTFSTFYIDNSGAKGGVSMVGTAGEVFVGVKKQGRINYFEGFLSLSDMFVDQNNTFLQHLQIYPNPVRNFFYFCSASGRNVKMISITTLTGIKIQDTKIEDSDKINLPVNLSPGVYIVEFYTEVAVNQNKHYS
jgi:hypothetical protein